MNDIILHISTEMDEDLKSLLALANRLYLQHHCGRRCLSGVDLLIKADKRELTVPFSAMNRIPYQATLSVRLTPWLIMCGLVKGTTLTFGRRLSSLGILAGASFAPDGVAVELPRRDYLF